MHKELTLKYNRFVITAFKNVAVDMGNAPEEVASLRQAVKDNGTLIAPSDAIAKRRRDLAFPVVAEAPSAELKKMLG